MRYRFRVERHAIVLGREVFPGDVLAIVLTEGRAVLSVELPFNPGAVLGACEDGTLSLCGASVADLRQRIAPRLDPRVIPFPAARRREA